MIEVYSLKNCDTCKKALKWLDETKIPYQNHDIRTDGLPKPVIEQIISHLGWETALNRRSITWRKLDDSDKENLDTQKAIQLVVEHPALLKRPVFIRGDWIDSGFNEAVKAHLE